MMRRTVALASAYVGTIFAANLAVATVGPVPVGLGLVAPAGVLFIPAAFTLSDYLYRQAGWKWTIAAILAGAGLSAAISGPLALASGLSLLVAPVLDLTVLAWLRERGWLRAVLASNAVGLVLDSMIFLWIAFGSWAFLAGQVWAKLALSALTVLALAVIRTRRVAVA